MKLKINKIKSKHAAMEMSVGTIVTIVLLMTVMILGLVLVRTIFTGAVENITGIDQAVKNEINKLFGEDATKKVVVYPLSRKITVQKGSDNLGFGFSIRNIETVENSFSYNISHVDNNCNMNGILADSLIDLGKDRTGITVPPGNVMEDPIFVRFSVPEAAPPCLIRYQLVVYYGDFGSQYTPNPIDVDVEIKSR